MNAAQAQTLVLIRQLRAVRPKRRVGRVPRPLSLEPIQREYLSAIAYVCTHARDAFAEVEAEILADLREQRRLAGHTDNVTKRKPFDATRARQLIARAASRFASRFRQTELHAIVKKFGQRTDKHQRQQLDRQLRAAIGVSFESIERPIRDHVEAWTTENVRLIKTVPDRYFDRIRSDVEDAYAGGMHPDTLAKKLRERHPMALRDAKRIARDQISKLNGKLNKERQTSLGVTGYTWRCVRDNRTRECHADLDGQPCTWDDPPEGGGTDEDEAGHPGEGINCRCFSEPDLSGLLG